MKGTKVFKGFWWLPDVSDNQIPGTLIVESDKITLETIGVLGTDILFDAIWGISSESKKISIFNGGRVSLSHNTACPFALATYDALFVAVGKHIKSLDELGNYDVKAYIEALSYWFKPNCLHSDEVNTCLADSDNAHMITAAIAEGCTLELKGESRVMNEKMGMLVRFEQESTLNLLFSKTISMLMAIEQVFLFEQFLSFATLIPVQSDRMLLIDKGYQSDSTNDYTIEIYDKYKNNHIIRSNRFWEYLFVYETIKDKFPSIICKWYEEKEIHPIRAHLVDSISHRKIFNSADFLIVTQAVEGFYCRFRKDGLKLDLILKRLRAEFADVSVIEMSNIDINRVVDTRNYYSHLLPSGKKDNVVVDGAKQYNLTHKLRKLLLCCMLNFVGFDNNEINAIFAHSQNSYLRMIGEFK